jgi:hypothetical protein
MLCFIIVINVMFCWWLHFTYLFFSSCSLSQRTDWEKQGRAASMNCCDLEHGDDSHERMNLRLFYGINDVLTEFYLKTICSITI